VSNCLNRTNSDQIRVFALCDEFGKTKTVAFCPFATRNPVLKTREKMTTYLFESNRLKSYSTRRIRQIVKQYANSAGITKCAYPHLFRHQIITYLTKQGIISPKLQQLSGHSEEKEYGIYRDLALSD